MFGPYGDEIPLEVYGQFPLADIFLPTLQPISRYEINDSVSGLSSEIEYNSSSYVGSPTSITSHVTCTPTPIQRSIISSQSFQNNLQVLSIGDLQLKFYYKSVDLTLSWLVNLKMQQGVNLVQRNRRSNSPLTSEMSIIESMNRTSRYSPEEKKERIDRYRSKRNLRNFHRKIKYECRKTLADRRPRVRGRFARNNEIEKPPQSQWDHITYLGLEENDYYDDKWICLNQYN
ncbi:hypothetical protein DH2020_028397 [Rehmannia glutinosa]|uniref:CCT domain-containing protein n=1 Tax=Rehmannia glutinosa TaxID=99300 RepID=A0ABR0VRI4_REHGL